MDVRLRFPLGNPIVLADSWPLEGYGAVIEFDRTGEQATAIIVTFRDQPVSLAPKITATPEKTEKSAIVRRLSEYIGLYQGLDVRLDNVEVTFLGKTDQERDEIKLSKFNVSKAARKRRFAFSMLAQAFFAGESGDDPSFVSHMAGLAREALIAEEYIDAFRYAFLLCEALYGGGKFKTVQLVQAMHSNDQFRAIVEAAMNDFDTEPIHRRSNAKQLIAQHPTALAMIEYLVAQRGFYFHGNLERKDAWHPDHQNKAQELAEIAVGLAGGIAHSFADQMFKPEIASRYFENARKQGAIMTINVEMKFKDEAGFEQNRTMRINTPGTRATNSMAMAVHAQFLEWAQVEMSDKNLISAVAVDAKSGKELFRSHYLSSDGAATG
ncbi:MULTISPECIES: hypothetical protein [Mesorhizobium]|uniref:hypothetical protein n=1 Tax=Mesorhizobium TaxID=68287 RepID=UPI000BAF08F3|nr:MULTISPECIES: hypothetical protein [Mesorhizobium]PBB59113.1 hypothetical protein CK217_26145 [Mesorhizobium loti]PBB85128.1 hypothetical protein CK216_19800 [Mesorhizobium sp. WSM3876]